jgi:hypothetical protein
MNVAPPKPPAANHTARRLLALEPGDSFRFYLGDLPDDIDGSRAATPAYAAVLEEVLATARSLQRMGRIALSERKVWLTAQGQRFRITEYRALGLAPRADDENEDYSGAEPEGTAAA